MGGWGVGGGGKKTRWADWGGGGCRHGLKVCPPLLIYMRATVPRCSQPWHGLQVHRGRERSGAERRARSGKRRGEACTEWEAARSSVHGEGSGAEREAARRGTQDNERILRIQALVTRLRMPRAAGQVGETWRRWRTNTTCARARTHTHTHMQVGRVVPLLLLRRRRHGPPRRRPRASLAGTRRTSTWPVH